MLLQQFPRKKVTTLPLSKPPERSQEASPRRLTKSKLSDVMLSRFNEEERRISCFGTIARLVAASIALACLVLFGSATLATQRSSSSGRSHELRGYGGPHDRLRATTTTTTTTTPVTLLPISEQQQQLRAPSSSSSRAPAAAVTNTAVPAASIRRSAALFRRWGRSGASGTDFVEATELMNPLLDTLGCGLTSMVTVNVVKLRRRGAADAGASIHKLIADESERGQSDKDDSVTVAALWNGRVLQLIQHLVDELLRSDLHAASIADIARAAYSATLGRHHNTFLRYSARALLSMAPDRKTLFEERLGYSTDVWDTELRDDLADILEALTLTLDRLERALEDSGLTL